MQYIELDTYDELNRPACKLNIPRNQLRQIYQYLWTYSNNKAKQKWLVKFCKYLDKIHNIFKNLSINTYIDITYQFDIYLRLTYQHGEFYKLKKVNKPSDRKFLKYFKKHKLNKPLIRITNKRFKNNVLKNYIYFNNQRGHLDGIHLAPKPIGGWIADSKDYEHIKRIVKKHLEFISYPSDDFS